MIKSFGEMRKIDISKHLEYREAKDEKGKKVEIPYLNWAMCKALLHEHGAERVYYEPLVDERTGSTLFCSNKTFTNSKEQSNSCYEVRVKVVIDDYEFIQNYPLLNGTAVVRDDTINQLRVSNAQARAFVKGVAIHTGLGFDLWVKGDESAPGSTASEDDLYAHDIMKIRDRLNEKITKLMTFKDMSVDDIAHKLGMEDADEIRSIIKMCTKINKFEKSLTAVMTND